MKRTLLFLTVVVATLSCRKDPDLYQLTDDFIVATFRDKNISFDSLKTYYIPDDVGYISNTRPNDSLLSPSKALQLVNRVKSNMDQRGFVSTSKDSADMAVNMFVIKDLNRTDVISPGYWWGYNGYYDPWYWGGYDYYYYPFSYSYTYTTGTLVIELIDLNDVSANNNKLVVVWNAISNGVLSGYPNNDMQQGLDAIDQSFAQSPYLVTN
jgi:hypothetical protein